MNPFISLLNSLHQLSEYYGTSYFSLQLDVKKAAAKVEIKFQSQLVVQQ